MTSETDRPTGREARIAHEVEVAIRAMPDPATAPRDLTWRLVPTGPAPSGLTAAQKIRLALALKAMELAEKATAGDIKADDEDIADFVHVVAGLVVPLAAMVDDDRDRVIANLSAIADKAVIRVAELERERHALAAQLHDAGVMVEGSRLIVADLEQERDDLAARLQDERCPDPPLHEESGKWRRYGIDAGTRVAELEQQRDAVLAYIVECERSAIDHGQDLLPGFKQIRAIYAEHGERGDG